jgi:hypothetical protein
LKSIAGVSRVQIAKTLLISAIKRDWTGVSTVVALDVFPDGVLD